MGILIFGGTRDAIIGTTQIVSYLQSVGVDMPCVYSLAGVTKNPRVPENVTVHSGGFGGVDGIVDYILQHNISAVFDFTHPYATQISAHIHMAVCELSLNDYAIDLYAYQRPSWAYNEAVQYKDTIDDIVDTTKDIQGHIFVALGAKSISKFAHHKGDIVLRAMQDIQVPNGVCVVGAPPKDIQQEKTLFDAYNFSAVICKDSGTENGYHKVQIALQKNIPVYMLNRPQNHISMLYSDTVFGTTIQSVVGAFIHRLNTGYLVVKS